MKRQALIFLIILIIGTITVVRPARSVASGDYAGFHVKGADFISAPNQPPITVSIQFRWKPCDVLKIKFADSDSIYYRAVDFSYTLIIHTEDSLYWVVGDAKTYMDLNDGTVVSIYVFRNDTAEVLKPDVDYEFSVDFKAYDPVYQTIQYIPSIGVDVFASSGIYRISLPESGQKITFRIYNYKSNDAEGYIYVYISDSFYIKISHDTNPSDNHAVCRIELIRDSGAVITSTWMYNSQPYTDTLFDIELWKDKIVLRITNYYDSANSTSATYRLKHARLKDIYFKTSYHVTFGSNSYGGRIMYLGISKVQEESSWFDPIINFFRNIFQTVGGFFANIVDRVGRFVKGAIDAVRSAVYSVINKFTELLGYFTDAFKTFFDKTIGFFNDLYDSYIAPFVDWFKENVTNLWNTVVDFVSTVVDFFSTVASAIQTAYEFMKESVEFIKVVGPFVLELSGVFLGLWLIWPLIYGDVNDIMTRFIQLEEAVMKLIHLAVAIFNAIVNLIHMIRKMIPLI